MLINDQSRRVDRVPGQPAVEVCQRVRPADLFSSGQEGVLQRIPRFVCGENPLGTQLGESRPVPGVAPFQPPFSFSIQISNSAPQIVSGSHGVATRHVENSPVSGNEKRRRIQLLSTPEHERPPCPVTECSQVHGHL